MLAESLYAHRFHGAVLEVASDRAIDTMVASMKGSQPPPMRDELDYYSIHVVSTLAAFTTEVSRLEESLVLLSCYRQSMMARRLGVTKSDHLESGIENIIIRTQIIYERALQLVDTVYELYNDPSLISHELVIRNARLRSTKTVSALKSLRKIVRAYAEPRNAIVHSGGWRDEGISSVQVATTMLKTADASRRQEKAFVNLRRARDKATAALVRSWTKDVKAFVKRVVQASRDLFESLEGPFKHRVARIRLICVGKPQI